MFKLLYTPEAKKRIKRLDPSLRKRLKVGLEAIAKDPGIGKRLTYHLGGKCSHRIGKYRIIYQVVPKENTVIILTLGHRQKVYEHR